ncbi:ABC transporter substrate-binding protein [Paraburkholderia sp. ZP32-5]|uniref:ABC transporter substrate-binding protein n=1 Tax=Paraburkholderia sp. ZP32-5 TaxID=2883245 RepID=UPI001F2E67F5|nr:ABC transporter substrate-binding protein [Paraburkholderia sp. ZP32-5]
MTGIYRTLCCALLTLGIATASHAQGALEKTHLAIATTGSVISYYPFEIALAKGYFKDEGLDVDRSMYAGGPQTLQALLGGSADMVVSAYSNTLTMAAHDQHVQAFVLMIKYPAFVLGITKQGQQKYTSLKSLASMKIGVTSPGSSTNMILDAIATRNGVDRKSYSVIGVGAQAGAIAAVKQGRLDALVGIDPTITMLTDSNDLKVVADLRTGKGVMDSVGSSTYPEGSVISTSEFIKKNPHTVQAVVNAMLRAEKFLQTATPEQIADALPKSYQVGDRATYLKAIEHTRSVYSTDGRYDPKGTEAVLNVLAAADPQIAQARSKIDLPSTYTNKFVDAATVKNP